MNGKGFDKNNKMIYEIKDGKGFIKEYFEDEKLRGEAEFLNGKINGKFKEYYYNGKIKFEGEYLYGKKWNGKGYDIQNNIAYEIINGKGIIKEYNEKGIIKFEGEYLNGDINGKGKEYSRNNIIEFEGEYLNGKRNGIGKE